MTHVERAPAKINLSLRVLSRREDGFHEIETLMVALCGVEDVIRFDLTAGKGEVKLLCDDPALPIGEDNLIMRALRSFSSRTGKEFCGEIVIEKRIPSGAGLGGGSSDAASTLRALNKISGSRLAVTDLRAVAGEIGADVAFFIQPEPSWCKGKGEVVLPFTGNIPGREVFLLKPAFSVATAWAYSSWEQSGRLPGVDYSRQSSPWGDLCNDLERPVFAKYLVLAAMKSWLFDQPEAEFAMMSGSGATVFALLHDRSGAADLRQRALAEFGAGCWVACARIGDGNQGD
jgi:4-diphosphocytidyl-2-C-methyl-D-erythritol kinase